RMPSCRARCSAPWAWRPRSTGPGKRETQGLRPAGAQKHGGRESCPLLSEIAEAGRLRSVQGRQGSRDVCVVACSGDILSILWARSQEVLTKETNGPDQPTDRSERGSQPPRS